jgi:hypothetical protein
MTKVTDQQNISINTGVHLAGFFVLVASHDLHHLRIALAHGG